MGKVSETVKFSSLSDRNPVSYPAVLKPLLTVVVLCGLLMTTRSVVAKEKPWWQVARETIENMNPFRQKPQPKRIGVSPGDNRSGGPKDLCPTTAYPLTSFVLPTNRAGFTSVEPVSSSHPTFWLYIPYTDRVPERTSRRLEFVLLGKDEQIIYEQRFLLPRKVGVVSISIPQTVSALQVGQRYRWVVSVICNSLNRAGDATVNGWIEPVDVSPKVNDQLLKARSAADKSLVYAKGQFWYETVSAIATSTQSATISTADLQKVKNALLKEVGLPENIPFLGAAKPAPPEAFRPGR